MQDGVYSDHAFAYPLPATYVSFDVGGNVSKYINTTRYCLFSFRQSLTSPSVNIGNSSVLNWTRFKIYFSTRTQLVKSCVLQRSSHIHIHTITHRHTYICMLHYLAMSMFYVLSNFQCYTS